MPRTIDTYTGENFVFNSTQFHAPTEMVVPAIVTKRTCKILHPSRCLPDLLRELNPGLTRSALSRVKDREWDD